MVMNYGSRMGTPITLIVCHTNEGPHPPGLSPDHTAEDLAAFLNGVEDSYHAIVDDDSTIRYLPDLAEAWAVLSGNARSLNICFTGYAHSTRDEWLTHMPMLRRGAAVVREWCDRFGIPRRKLAPGEVGRNMSGICGHVDWTVGKGDGTHWDPGPDFPYDVFIGLVNGGIDTSALDKRSRRRTEDNSMILPASATRIDAQIPTDVVGGWCGDANLLLTANTGGAVVHGIYMVADRGSTPPQVTPILTDTAAGQVYNQWWPLKHPLAHGTTSVVVNYTAPAGMVAHIEYQN